MAKPITCRPMRIFSALILVGILSLGISLKPIEAAVANPAVSFAGESVLAQSSPRDNRLNQSIIKAIREDLARKTGIAPGQLRIAQSSRQTWPDGCLGLAEPDQICTQALVEGWRVVVSYRNRSWVYRTNASGSLIKLEP